MPRVQADLASRGIHCGRKHMARKHMARLMRQAGLAGCHRRGPFPTTQRDSTAQPAPDLVGRTFAARAPNQLWIADST